MFTGIIEEVGRIESVTEVSQGRRLVVGASSILEDAKTGESINTNGVCLTIVGKTRESFSCDVSAETLRRTNLGEAARGTRVNLERALAIGGRLGGHFVQGHADCTTSFLGKRQEGDSWMFRFSLPQSIARYVALKGSISINGVSLTVASLAGGDFEIAIIPHTLAMTNFGDLKPGDAVNLEADMIAKYLERLVADRPAGKPSSSLTVERLLALGYGEEKS